MIAQLSTRSLLKELRPTQTLRYSWCLAKVKGLEPPGEVGSGAVWPGAMVWWEGSCGEMAQELQAYVTHPLQITQSATA